LLALFGLICFLPNPAAAAKKPEVAGTYTIQGAKGAIVLALQDEPENKVSGILNGGDLNAPAPTTTQGHSQANPLAANTSASDFSGTFKDENLTIESKNVPNQAGVFTGIGICHLCLRPMANNH
jgi:hypothetical protein